MTTARNPQLLIRQYGLIDPKLRDAVVVVAGAGMLGSWAALSLARVAHEVHVWDFDTVDDVNLGTQVYTDNQLGKPKVTALAEITSGLPVIPHDDFFPLDLSPEDMGLQRTYEVENPLNSEKVPMTRPLVIVCAVDSFKARAEIAAWARTHGADLFTDSRAHGELTVSMIVPPDKLEQYIGEIPDDESAPEPACGMEGTSFVGQFSAARITSGINSYFRGLPTAYMLVEHIGFGEVTRRVAN